MRLFKSKPDTIVIVGNGFDLAHGYKTSYESFVENTTSEHLETFKSYCDHEKIETWYLFEDNINLITEKLFMRSIEEYCDFEDNRIEIKALTTAFKEVQKLLLKYLSREIKSKPFVKKCSIEKHICRRGVAINGNYTNTAENYIKKVFYVHGSLEEKDIILGYDFRDERCLAQFEDMQWSKMFCRKALAFRRFLRQRKHLCPNSEKYKELLSGFERYQNLVNSSKGIEDEDWNSIPHARIIRKFLKRYPSQILPKIHYKSIESVVILGHGIEADKVYLKNLLERCERLSRVVIFRYDGEPEESYQNKSSFFVPYCSNIEQAYY